MVIKKDQTTDADRAGIWEDLFLLRREADDSNNLWLDAPQAISLNLLIEMRLIEPDYSLPSIDKDADNWRKYFKRTAYRITESGNKILENRGEFIHSGLPKQNNP